MNTDGIAIGLLSNQEIKYNTFLNMTPIRKMVGYTSVRVGVLFEKMVSLSLEKNLNKNELTNLIKKEPFYNDLDNRIHNKLIKSIYQAKVVLQQYYKNKEIKKVFYIGDIERHLGIGYKTDILLEVKDKNTQAYEKIAISVKTIQGEELSSIRVRLSTIGHKTFKEITNNNIVSGTSIDTIKNTFINILPQVLGDKRYPDMDIFFVDVIRNKMFFIKEKELTKILIEAFKKGIMYLTFKDNDFYAVRLYDQKGDKLLHIENRGGIGFLMSYPKILQLAKEILTF